MHSSRSLLVSGQAQQIFFFFGVFDTSHADAVAGVSAVAAAAGVAGVVAVTVGWFEAEEEEGAATPFCTCALPIESRSEYEWMKKN